jgi:hypothetical protein
MVTGHEATLSNWTARQAQIRAEIIALRPPPPTDPTPTPPTRAAQRAPSEEREVEESIDGSGRPTRNGERQDDKDEDLYGKQLTRQPDNPRKRRAPDSPPPDQRIQMPREEFLRMQDRLEALEREQARRTSSASSRHSLSTPSIPRRDMSQIRTPLPPLEELPPLHFGQQPAVVPYTPGNVDGILHFPALQPAAVLDMRLILWPHVSTELIRTIMSNA